MNILKSVSWCTNLNNLETLIGDNNLIVGTQNSIQILSRLIPEKIYQNAKVFTRMSGYPNVKELEVLSTRPSIQNDFDNLICVGGGGTLDFGKLIVSDIPNIGVIYKIPRIVLIPTNIGSGAEITRFSTLWNYDSKLKTSVVLPENIQSQVFYMEAPLKSLNDKQLEIGILDALAHSFDSFFSKKSDPLTRIIAKRNIQEICGVLDSYYDNKIALTNNLIELQVYSCIGGLCINQTKSSISHAFSYGLTLEFGIVHGYSVALMMQLAVKRFQHDLIQIYPDFLNTIELIVRTLDKANLELKVPSIKFLISNNVDELVNQVDQIRLQNFVLDVQKEDYKEFFLTT